MNTLKQFMKYQITTINEDKFEELAETADVIWHQCYSELLSGEQIDYMLGKYLSVEAFKEQAEEGYIYRGLFIDGELVGFTGSQKQGDRIFLSKLYLQERYHGLGLGKALMDDCIGLYPECISVYLTVNKHNSSYNMYRHLGFEVIDSVVTDIGEGFVMDDYIMQRRLMRQ